MNSSVVWNSQDPTLSGPSQDDFQQFLDMGAMNGLGDSLQFDFQDFGNQQAQSGQLMQQDDGDAMETGIDGRGGIGQDTTMQDQISAMTTAASHPAILGTAMGHEPSPSDSLSSIDAQIQYLQQQRHQQQQRQIQEQQRNFYVQSRMIPPTPNSIEMHPSSAQFYPQSDPQQQAMFERYRMQVKEQEMAFTPLVSPAVTPLDAHFNIPEYTVTGAYFSPLSSPALHAQTEQSSIYEQRIPGTNDTSLDLNQESYSSLGSASIMPPRKTSKKALAKPRNPRAPRQSPIVKPRRGKKASSTSLPAQTLENIMEPTHTQEVDTSKTASSSHAGSTEESENGSISPEHLSDMAPPPIPQPGSAGKSPYLHVQKPGMRTQQLVMGSPATPASLMRLTQSPQTGQPSNNVDMDIDELGMDGFALPEAANVNKPPLSRLDTQSDGQTTPTLNSSGGKTPHFQTLPSPAFTQSRTAASASQSPQIDAMNGLIGGAARRTPSIAARGSKKRSSTSVLASPALLPRISPSIKPLLPGGGKVSDDTASLLLASKSNYQNILEGNHLPGVSYPSELSTNLTSKRTSHKIAEQGRRNRINSALQEIATLLPRGSIKDSGGEKSGSGDAGDNDASASAKAAAQSANSKASTVEQAIEYIKQLKQDLADATKRAEEAEKQLTVKT